MTSLLSAKKRAEEFAAAVDGGADRSALRPELAELVGVVATLKREAGADAPVAPDPAFTAELRDRLMDEAATSFSNDNVLVLPARRKGSRERRIALAASSLVLIGGSAGMAAAGQNALPGEALYPIKRGLEKAEAGLATSQSNKGQDLLDQADSRLTEVRGLFETSSDLSQVPDTLEAFSQQATEGSQVLIEEYESGNDDTLIAELRTFAAENLAELRDLAKSAPAEHQDELAVAAETLMRIDARAQAVCPSCASDLKSLEMPALFLTANEAREAMDAVSRVQVNNDHPTLPDQVQPKPGDGKGQSPAGGDGQRPATDGDAPKGDGGPWLPEGGVGTTAPGGDAGALGDLIEGVTGGLLDGAGSTGDTGTSGGTGGKGGKGGTGGTGSTGQKDGRGEKDGSVDKIKELLPDELDPVLDTLLP